MFNLNDYSRKPLYKDIPLLEIDNDGSKHWYLNGKLHRVDGPAVEWATGSKHWYVNGKLHRVDGPALEWANGLTEWWVNGKLHKEDGPAREWADGSKFWFLNDEYLTEQEFNQRPGND